MKVLMYPVREERTASETSKDFCRFKNKYKNKYKKKRGFLYYAIGQHHIFLFSGIIEYRVKDTFL